MKVLKQTFLAIFLAGALSVAASAQSEWLGSYVFEESGGRTAGGTGIVVSHQIDVREGDDGLIANITSNGYQTSKDLICSTKIVGTKLLIYFDSYGENNVLEPFEQGDLLLTLERKIVKNKTEIFTTWGKFTPIAEKNGKNNQIYFRQIVVEKDLL